MKTPTEFENGPHIPHFEGTVPASLQSLLMVYHSLTAEPLHRGGSNFAPGFSSILTRLCAKMGIAVREFCAPCEFLCFINK